MVPPFLATIVMEFISSKPIRGKGTLRGGPDPKELAEGLGLFDIAHAHCGIPDLAPEVGVLSLGSNPHVVRTLPGTAGFNERVQ